MPRHLRTALAASGTWWRFTRYQIAGGSIVPAPGAKLELYSPWKLFMESKNRSAGRLSARSATDVARRQPPYQSLMNLVRGLEYKPGQRRYPQCLTAESLEAITKWCAAYGPLGVLLSRWESIRLAAIEKEPDYYTQLIYLRGYGSTVHPFETDGEFEPGKPSVVIHDLVDLLPHEESPGETWHRFFPTIRYAERDSFPYPKPYSAEFCDLYAERVSDFCRAAEYLAGALLHLQRNDQPTTLAQRQALEAINLLRRPVTAVLKFDKEKKPISSWESPSLLASFAEMRVQDLLSQRPVLICSCCGAPFVSMAYQAEYCSTACRYRGQRQRLRLQTKEAPVLYAKGKTVQQIADKMNQDPEIVKRWLTKAGVLKPPG